MGTKIACLLSGSSHALHCAGSGWIPDFGCSWARQLTSTALLSGPLSAVVCLRFGLTGTTTVLIVIASMSIWGAIHDRGPFTEPGPLNGVLSLQLFLLVTAVPFMFWQPLLKSANMWRRQLKRRATAIGAAGRWDRHI